MSSTLYVLTGQALALQQMAFDGEIDEQTFKDTMESLDYEIEEKADTYAKIDKMLDAEIKALAAEITRLTGRKKTLENNQDRLKRNLESTMIALGKTKFKTLLFSFGIQKNPVTVKVIGKVPKRFYIPQEPKLDKKALIEYVKEHGNTKYAELTQSESLRIRQEE